MLDSERLSDLARFRLVIEVSGRLPGAQGGADPFCHQGMQDARLRVRPYAGDLGEDAVEIAGWMRPEA
jgi:phosphoketolase